MNVSVVRVSVGSVNVSECNLAASSVDCEYALLRLLLCICCADAEGQSTTNFNQEAT